MSAALLDYPLIQQRWSIGSLFNRPSYVIQAAAPGDGILDRLVQGKLGFRGWERLNQFRHDYEDGWGAGRGRALSPVSLQAFFLFLAHAEFPPQVIPSLFLTEEGQLELAWEDKRGSTVEVGFGADRIEFFSKTLDKDDSVSLNQVEQLAALLNRL